LSTYLAKMLIGPQDHFHCGNPSEIAWSYSPAVERVTLVLEGIGDGKVRVNSSSLDFPLVILAGEALEIVGGLAARPTGSTTTRPGWSRRATVRRPSNALHGRL
jgi:hypothetical protein